MLILLKFKEPQRKNLIFLIIDDAFSTSTQIENVAFLRPTLKTMSLFLHSGTRAMATMATAPSKQP